MSYPTLTEIKRAKVARMSAAVEELARDLAAYAREHGGSFVIFGSAGRGEMRVHSDVDILVDFTPDGSDDAWHYAELRAFALGLVPDVQKRAWLGDRLQQRIAREGRVLS